MDQEKGFREKKRQQYNLYELYVYLKNYLSMHVQPSPKEKDHHLLPSSFPIRDVHSKFCLNFKEWHECEEQQHMF